MKPVTLPMGALHHRDLPWNAFLLSALHSQHGPFVILWHHLDELGLQLVPLDEDSLGYFAVSVAQMARDQVFDLLHIFFAHQGLQLHRVQNLLIAADAEVARLVEHVSDAARHAGGKVSSRFAEHDDAPSGHVLAAVIPDALDDCIGAAIAYGETLAGDAAEVGFAAGGAVEHHIANQNIFFGNKGGLMRRIDDDLAARKALAEVIVGVAFEGEADALGEEGPKALSRLAGEQIGRASCRE